MKINDRQKNFSIASSAAGITFVGIIVLYFFFIAPIQNHQTEKFLETCDQLDLQCTVEVNWLVPFGLAVIPFMVFAAFYYHFETKRTKTWRSYR